MSEIMGKKRKMRAEAEATADEKYGQTHHEKEETLQRKERTIRGAEWPTQRKKTGGIAYKRQNNTGKPEN